MQVAHAWGCLTGGIDVDRAFKLLLDKVLGQLLMAKVSDVAKTLVLHTFEDEKCNAVPGSGLTINISPIIMNLQRAFKS